jgi:hypothetical protein
MRWNSIRKSSNTAFYLTKTSCWICGTNLSITRVICFYGVVVVIIIIIIKKFIFLDVWYSKCRIVRFKERKFLLNLRDSITCSLYLNLTVPITAAPNNSCRITIHSNNSNSVKKISNLFMINKLTYYPYN